MLKIDDSDIIVINPPAAVSGSIIWLHGLGADGNDFVPVARQLANLNLRFVFPNAPMRPVTVNGGFVMRAWYDIISAQVDSHADEKGCTESVSAIRDLVAREIAGGIPANKIILAGFSQGAVISLLTGLTHPEKLGGIIALSGYLPDPEKTLREAPAANRTTPIFLGHGTDDDLVPVSLGIRVSEALQKAKHPVSWHAYPIGHSVCMEEILDISAWLTKHV